MSSQTKPAPTKFGVVIFPGFQALDAFGPLDAINNLSSITPLEFVALAATLDPVSTRVPAPGRIGQSIVPTHTFDDCPEDLEVLLVCTGSAIVAMSGILDGRRATSNKKSWEWATSQGPAVNWVRQARWVVDGNVWTSSGVSAGIDLIFAFIEDQYGEEVATQLVRQAEYVRNTDSSSDPFA
ncbi:hypothetical protein CIB48_g7888 [Xylaria polymorpha]|nr:hypothetical protein CIB48_g7888 [Xylaria polymorpha]